MCEVLFLSLFLSQSLSPFMSSLSFFALDFTGLILLLSFPDEVCPWEINHFFTPSTLKNYWAVKYNKCLQKYIKPTIILYIYVHGNVRLWFFWYMKFLYELKKNLSVLGFSRETKSIGSTESLSLCGVCVCVRARMRRHRWRQRLAHVFVGAGRSKFCRAGRQAGDKGRVHFVVHIQRQSGSRVFSASRT